MAAGKLVTSLRDVEIQLQRAALAVKLHLEMLKKDSQQTVVQSREAKAQIIALSTSIDAMLSELNSGTTEILALIAKSLAVGATEMDPSGEETETEDEMELEEKAAAPIKNEATLLLVGDPWVPCNNLFGECELKVETQNAANEDANEQLTSHGSNLHADPDSKKRPRLGLVCDDCEVKRPARGDVTSIVERYADLASFVVQQHKTNPSVVPPELYLLKQTGADTNVTVLEFLKAGRSFDEATSSNLCTATKHLAQVICSISKDLVESSWAEEIIGRITEIARLLIGDAMLEHHDKLLKCASRLRRHLIKNYGYASYEDDDASLDAIEERVEWYKRDARQLKPKVIARPICSITTQLVNDLENLDSKSFFRTEENWERFTALGNVVAGWMVVAEGSNKAKTHRKYFRGLSMKLIKLNEQYPGRLPPALLRYTKRLS